MGVLTPNMNLNQPTVGVDTGLTWEQDTNANASILDGHNHTPGYGVQITPSGLNINSNLPFQNNQAINLQATVFTQQSSLSTLNALFVGTDGNLYFNDGVGDPSIQITKSGSVFASSSGIASGTASAAFSSGTLVVLSAALTPANIQGASILLGNNVASSKYLTLSPPSSMAANITETLPTIPAATSIMQMDSSGNMTAALTVDASTIVISGNVLKVPSGAITGTQTATNINLPGKSVQESGSNVVVSNTNATNSIAIIRQAFDSSGIAGNGEGASAVHTGTGVYTITYSTGFGDPSVPVACIAFAGNIVSHGSAVISNIGTNGCTVNTFNSSGTATDLPFNLYAIGQRA